jgi:selenide,water dikinase
MVKGSGVSAEIYADRIPVLTSVMKHAVGGAIPGGTRNNLEFIEDVIEWAPEIPELLKFVLCDAQTSGGLLISLPAIHGEELIKQLILNSVSRSAIIGRIVSGNNRILVK